jgi:rubrerythrin
MSNTRDNFEIAFARESQADLKCLFFADKAEMIWRHLEACMEVMRNG